MNVKRIKDTCVLQLYVRRRKRMIISETKFLVKKAQRHDKNEFTELMQLYMKDMYRTAIAILWNIEVSCYEQKTFWSLYSYMMRSRKEIENTALSG